MCLEEAASTKILSLPCHGERSEILEVSVFDTSCFNREVCQYFLHIQYCWLLVFFRFVYEPKSTIL